MSPKVYILGYGNLGKHLLDLFLSRGIKLGGVFSNQTLELSGVQTFSKTNINEILVEGDIVFITTKDSDIHSSILQISNDSVIKLYCSGSLALSEFIDCNHVGIWYPLYSFSSEVEIDWKLVPVFVEYSDSVTQMSLEKLNNSLNLNIRFLSSEDRAQLHLSAVFANNFVNACFIGSQEVLRENEHLSFNYLLPIIQQTIDKLKLNNPISVQTGPAFRGDKTTISTHLKQLSNCTEEAEIYRSISKYIQQKFKK
jgi:predicted short-subunit dehydrogenase-like oxidoreductase (DUF2520 family)